MYVSLAIFFLTDRVFVCLFLRVGLPSTRNPAIKILKTPLSRTYERTAENEHFRRSRNNRIWFRTGERMPLNCFGFFLRFITYLKLIFFSFKKFVFLVTWLYQSSRVVQQSGLSLGDTFKCLARHLSPANIFFFQKGVGEHMTTYVSFQTWKWDMFRRGQRFKQEGQLVCNQKKSLSSNKCGYLWTSSIKR